MHWYVCVFRQLKLTILVSLSLSLSVCVCVCVYQVCTVCTMSNVRIYVCMYICMQYSTMYVLCVVRLTHLDKHTRTIICCAVDTHGLAIP